MTDDHDREFIQFPPPPGMTQAEAVANRQVFFMSVALACLFGIIIYGALLFVASEVVSATPDVRIEASDQ